MGEQLLKIYEEATKLGGGWACVKLAMIRRIPSTKAKHLPNSPEYVRKFQAALQKIRHELNLIWYY